MRAPSPVRKVRQIMSSNLFFCRLMRRRYAFSLESRNTTVRINKLTFNKVGLTRAMLVVVK